MCSLPRRLPRRLAAHQTVPALPLTKIELSAEEENANPVVPKDAEPARGGLDALDWRHSTEALSLQWMGKSN
jgi:hypothetical protein